MLRIARCRRPGCTVQKASKICYTLGWIGSRQRLLRGRNRLWSMLKSGQQGLKSRPIHRGNKVPEIRGIWKPAQWRLRDLRRRRQRGNPKGRVWGEGGRGTAPLHGLGMKDNLSRNIGFHLGVFYFASVSGTALALLRHYELTIEANLVRSTGTVKDLQGNLPRKLIRP